MNQISIYSRFNFCRSPWQESQIEPGEVEVTRNRVKQFYLRLPLDDQLIRILDISISFSAIVFLFPLMVAVGVLVMLGDSGPVLFRQTRMGFGGRTFTCLKFRTMRKNADALLTEVLASNPRAQREWDVDRKLKKDPRITRIGSYLRKSSIDELPQLFNVLKGEMSLVGPRPIVPEEVERYGRHYIRYCKVRPGITGLWQTKGRNDIPYNRRVAYDVAYVRHHCMLLNLRILFDTIPAVLLRRGSY